MPEIVCIFVWLIYNFYFFALSMRFLKIFKVTQETKSGKDIIIANPVFKEVLWDGFFLSLYLRQCCAKP